MFALTNPHLGGLVGDPFGGVLLHLTPASVFLLFYARYSASFGMDKPLKQRQPTIGAGPNTMGSTLSPISLTSSSDRDQQLEKLLKENKQLKQKVDTLEKENITLKKSIYDLSTHYASAISQGGLKYPSLPYVLDPEVSAKDVITKGQDLINKAVHEVGGSVDSYKSGRFYAENSIDWRMVG
jgi:COMPASS component SWD3